MATRVSHDHCPHCPSFRGIFHPETPVRCALEVERKESENLAKDWGIPAEVIRMMAIELTDKLKPTEQLQRSLERIQAEQLFIKGLLQKNEQSSLTQERYEALCKRVEESSTEIDALILQVESLHETEKTALEKQRKASEDFWAAKKKRDKPNCQGRAKTELNQKLVGLTQERSRSAVEYREASTQLKKRQDELMAAKMKLTRLTADRDRLAQQMEPPKPGWFEELQTRQQFANKRWLETHQALEERRRDIEAFADEFVETHCDKGEAMKVRIKKCILSGESLLHNRDSVIQALS